MNDEQLDNLKKFMDSFTDFDDFKNRFIIHHPEREELFTLYFKESRLGGESWELTKIFVSNETVRLDSIFKRNPNISINELLDELKKYDLNKYKRVLIKLNNADYENIEKLSELGLDLDILVQGDKGYCSLKEFKTMRKFFNDFKHRYETYNLSMLEKIILSYDYVKFYFANEETSSRKSDSRSIVKCILTGNIVCEGYCKIFCQLLKEMGINSNLVYIDPKSDEDFGHVRVVLRVDDDKYNVHDNFVFDPTWDSNRNTKLVSNNLGKKYYKSEKLLRPDETIIRDVLSDCRYTYFMVPIEEFKKYFPEDVIEKIVKYPSNDKIILNDDLKFIFSYDDKKPRNNSILTYLEDLLRKTKKVEGYDDKQIDQLVDDSIGILKQLRFGLYDKYVEKKNNR